MTFPGRYWPEVRGLCGPLLCSWKHLGWSGDVGQAGQCVRRGDGGQGGARGDGQAGRRAGAARLQRTAAGASGLRCRAFFAVLVCMHQEALNNLVLEHPKTVFVNLAGIVILLIVDFWPGYFFLRPVTLWPNFEPYFDHLLIFHPV